MRVCGHHIALGVDICFAICPSIFHFATSGLFQPHTKYKLGLSFAMAICFSCPCRETGGHIRRTKSPCGIMPAEPRDTSICRTLSLLSQGISYPKATRVTPCKFNRGCAHLSPLFLTSGHETCFQRLYRIPSHLHTPTSPSNICYCYQLSLIVQIVPHDKRSLVLTLAILASLDPHLDVPSMPSTSLPHWHHPIYFFYPRQ